MAVARLAAPIRRRAPAPPSPIPPPVLIPDSPCDCEAAAAAAFGVWGFLNSEAEAELIRRDHERESEEECGERETRERDEVAVVWCVPRQVWFIRRVLELSGAGAGWLMAY